MFSKATRRSTNNFREAAQQVIIKQTCHEVELKFQNKGHNGRVQCSICHTTPLHQQIKNIYICIIDFMGFCRNTEMVLCNTICIWFSSKQKGFSAQPFVERVLYKTIPEPLENHFDRVFYNTICKRFCEQPLEGSKKRCRWNTFSEPFSEPFVVTVLWTELAFWI